MKRKIIFVVLLMFNIICLFAEPNGAYSIANRIAYKAVLFIFFAPLTITAALWYKTGKTTKRSWGVAILFSLSFSAIIYAFLPMSLQKTQTTFVNSTDKSKKFISEKEEKELSGTYSLPEVTSKKEFGATPAIFC